MKILFLHGWQSTPGGVKPTYLTDHGHEALNPALPDDDFDAAVRIAQVEFDRGKPDVVVGSSRGGAVAMNIEAGETPLVLLCPAWKRWGTAKTVKLGTVILHSSADDVVPFTDSQELLRNSGLPESTLIAAGTDHRLADPEPLATMLETVESAIRANAQQPVLEQIMNLDDFNEELRWCEVQDALHEFQSLLSVNVPKLCIERNADVLSWERQNGVYLLFGEQEQLLYIGYTLDGFGTRNKSHAQNKAFRWMDIIVFPKDVEFFAPSLEVFLRRRFLPQLDRGGKHV